MRLRIFGGQNRGIESYNLSRPVFVYAGESRRGVSVRHDGNMDRVARIAGFDDTRRAGYTVRRKTPKEEMTETVRQSICRTVLIVVDILFINLSIGRNILDKYKFIGQNKITFYNHRTRRERRRIFD